MPIKLISLLFNGVFWQTLIGFDKKEIECYSGMVYNIRIHIGSKRK